MQTMAQEWIEEGKLIGLKQGRDEGLKEGETQGLLKARREMILHVLRRRFSPNLDLIPAIGYTSNEALLQQIEQQLLQISDGETLNQLVDAALAVLVLPDFLQSMQIFVPPLA